MPKTQKDRENEKKLRGKKNEQSVSQLPSSPLLPLSLSFTQALFWHTQKKREKREKKEEDEKRNPEGMKESELEKN